MEEEKVKENEELKEEEKLNVNDKKFQEENIDFFFKQLEQIKWEKDKPNEPQIEIRKLLKAIDKKYFLTFEKKLASSLVPELKKQHDKLDFQDQPYFLKNTFVADASFLTNYQKISKFIKDHSDLKKSEDFLQKSDLFSSQVQPQSKFYKPHPFETNLTNKNLNDVHSNSKHFFPLYKDMQFTDFGEMNKEKANSNNFLIQQNWPNMNNFERRPGDGRPEYTPEKNIYPASIIGGNRNEVFTDFIRTEQKQKETQNDRMKLHIEALGGIEDTISIMNKTFKNNENLKLELTNNLNLIEDKSHVLAHTIDRESRFETIKMKKDDAFLSRSNFFGNDPFNADPLLFGNNINLVNNNRSDYVVRDDLDEPGVNFNSPLEKSMRSAMKPNNLDEGLRILKLSKDLRKEKEEMFQRKKFQKT